MGVELEFESESMIVLCLCEAMIDEMKLAGTEVEIHQETEEYGEHTNQTTSSLAGSHYAGCGRAAHKNGPLKSRRGPI